MTDDIAEDEPFAPFERWFAAAMAERNAGRDDDPGDGDARRRALGRGRCC